MASRTYQELLSQATWNVELFKESIADQGISKIPTSLVGSPRFQQCGKTMGLYQTAAASGFRSAASVSPIVDVTANFTLEIGLVPFESGDDLILSQYGSGGLYPYWNGALGRLLVYIFDNVGGTARLLYTPNNSVPIAKNTHIIIESINGGTSGACWIDSISSTIGLGGAGVAASVSGVVSVGANLGKCIFIVTRSWNSLLNSDEVKALYREYTQFTRPSKC